MQRPTGVITFLFTDIEGSTRLWETAPEAMRLALARHDLLLRQAIEAHEGYVFKTVGDAFCAAFPSAALALCAALEAQLALANETWGETGLLRVRMGLHTGTAEERDDDYFGPAVNRVARLQSAGHGQQVLLSDATRLKIETLPADVHLVEKGRHRLKDLTDPETLWQLNHPALPADHPPLKTLDTLSNNLEQQLTSFIGREKELEEVKRLVNAGRLVTLLGTGGIGKTRLALQVAADLIEQFPDGVWIIELAALSDPALIPPAVAAALSVREEAGKDLTATLFDFFKARKARKALLVFDNCEHLIQGCARFVDTLLKRCPEMRVLATSREGLDVPGETLYRVPSLGMPTEGQRVAPEHLRDYDACRLMIERATQHRADFHVTPENASALAHICRQLDGIPLALELAAARTKSMSIEQVSNRLDDRFRLLTGGSRVALPRQQTLRALVDWSYELLTEQERRLFWRLSVFAGGWTLAMAEQVCAGDDIEDWEILDILGHLVEKSLILYEESREEPRYRMLETLRQYGSEKLQAADETTALRTAHRDYFHSFALPLQPKLRGPEQVLALNQLELERDNFRSALDWCVCEQEQRSQTSPEERQAQVEKWLEMIIVLERLWNVRTSTSEGRARFAQALAFQDNASVSMRARALNTAGNLAIADVDYPNAASYHLQSLELRRTLNDRAAIAISLNNMAVVADGQGDFDTMRKYLEESLSIYREQGQNLFIGATLLNLGVATSRQGHFALAQNYYEESLLIMRTSGHTQYLGQVLHNLGDVMLRQQVVEQAYNYLQESIRIRSELGDEQGLLRSLERLATVAMYQRDYERAARWQGAVETVMIAANHHRAPAIAQDVEQDLETLHSCLTQEAFAAAWRRGENQSLAEVLTEVLQRETS